MHSPDFYLIKDTAGSSLFLVAWKTYQIQCALDRCLAHWCAGNDDTVRNYNTSSWVAVFSMMVQADFVWPARLITTTSHSRRMGFQQDYWYGYWNCFSAHSYAPL
jgi:hypothetical protein